MYAPETPVIDATQVSYDDVIASIYQQGDIDDENSIFKIKAYIDILPQDMTKAKKQASIAGILSVNGINVDDLIETMFSYLEEGPQFYDEDTITDQPVRQIVAELIREKALRLLQDEIPHGIAVSIDSMKERPGKNLFYDIDATIVCERDSHKGIIIGKNGAMLKKSAPWPDRTVKNSWAPRSISPPGSRSRRIGETI